MLLSLGGDNHRFRDPPWWFFMCGGGDLRGAMNSELAGAEEKAAGAGARLSSEEPLGLIL